MSFAAITSHTEKRVQFEPAFVVLNGPTISNVVVTCWITELSLGAPHFFFALYVREGEVPVRVGRGLNTPAEFMAGLQSGRFAVKVRSVIDVDMDTPGELVPEPEDLAKLAVWYDEALAAFKPAATQPFLTFPYRGFRIDTLPGYTTPYFFAVGPAPLGSRNHFPTLRRLKNYMDKLAKAGKLPTPPSTLPSTALDGLGAVVSRAIPGTDLEDGSPILSNEITVTGVLRYDVGTNTNDVHCLIVESVGNGRLDGTLSFDVYVYYVEEMEGPRARYAQAVATAHLGWEAFHNLLSGGLAIPVTVNPQSYPDRWPGTVSLSAEDRGALAVWLDGVIADHERAEAALREEIDNGMYDGFGAVLTRTPDNITLSQSTVTIGNTVHDLGTVTITALFDRSGRASGEFDVAVRSARAPFMTYAMERTAADGLSRWLQQNHALTSRSLAIDISAQDAHAALVWLDMFLTENT